MALLVCRLLKGKLMAEADRLDSGKRWLWIDFETSGLDIEDLTLLEFACTVTDSDLKQLVPVRSRLCAICAPNSDTGLMTPRNTDWDTLVDQVVVRMHIDSGLTREYRDAPDRSILRSIQVIDQLAVDMLFDTGWDGNSKVVLAGSGIAGFDRPLLTEFRSRIPNFSHYRSADVSIALEIAGVPVPKTEEALSDTLANLGASGLLPVIPLITPLHRAANDITGSILLARALRERLTK